MPNQSRSFDGKLKMYPELPLTIIPSKEGGAISTTWIVMNGEGDEVAEFSWHDDAKLFVAAKMDQQTAIARLGQ
jgi:hypothetical protein